MSKSRLFFLCVLALQLPLSAFAEERRTTVTTTARAPMEAFETDRSVDALEEEELLERQATNLGDAFSEEAGVYQQATTRGSEALYLRGLIGPENLILVDGVRFNQATFRTGPNQYLATIDPWALQRAEVVRGPGSVLYGSGAMGGVLQVFPRTPADDPLQGRAILHYKSADHTMGGAVDGSFRHDPFAVSAGLSLRTHDTLRVGSRGNEDISLTAEQEGRMLASEYDQRFWRFGSEVALSDDLRFHLNYMGGQIVDARRADQLGRGQMRSTDNRDDMLWGRLTAQNTGFADEVSAFLAYHRTDETMTRYQCDLDQGSFFDCASLRSEMIESRREVRDVVNTVGAGVSAYSWLGEAIRLSYGLEGYHDRVLSDRRDAGSLGEPWVEAARGNFTDGSSYTTVGSFVHSEYSLWHSEDHEVLLNGGLRGEHFRAFAPEVTATLGDIEFANTGLVGGLGVSYLYGTVLNLYLNWNQGFRAPNLQESTVLGDTGNFFEIPNPDLGPERNDTFELGTKLDIGAVGQFSGALFTSLMRDRITAVPGELDGVSEIDGKPVQIRVNADRAYFYGAEAGLRSRSLFGFHLFGNAAYIDGAVQRDQADPNFEPGPLHELFAGEDNWTNTRRLPPFQFLGGLTYRFENRWSATFFVEGAGAQRRLASGDRNDLRICEVEPGVLFGERGETCPGTPGWATLNLRGAYRFTDALVLHLALTNLTDLRYQRHGSGLLGPGFQGQATLSAQF